MCLFLKWYCSSLVFHSLWGKLHFPLRGNARNMTVGGDGGMGDGRAAERE